MMNASVTDTDSSTFEWTVLFYFLPSFLFGFIGNVTILYVYHVRVKQTIFGFFVRILAVVDLATVFVSIPGSFVFRSFSPSLDAEQMCKFLIFINHFIALIAGFLLSIIALERYRKVCRPHGKQITMLLAKRLCLGVIGLSLCLSLPNIFIIGATVTPVVYNDVTRLVVLCDYQNDLKRNGYSVISAVVVDVEFFGIACFLTVVYSIIGKTLKGRLKGKDRCPSNRPQGKVATKIFFVLTIVFITSLLPLMIISTLFSCFRSPPTLTHLTKALFDLGVYLPYINSIVNPIVYSFTSRVFRRELRSLCHRNRRPRTETVTDSEDTIQTATTSL